MCSPDRLLPGLLLVVTIALAGACGPYLPLASEPLPSPVPGGDFGSPDEHDGAVRILHPLLAERLRLLESRSPRFRAEMEALRQGDLPVYLTTSDPLIDAANGVAVRWRVPDDRLGEFASIHDHQTGMLKALVVRVNLQQITIRHRRWVLERGLLVERGLTARTHLEEAVDGILIHEVWGHLIPVARAGGLGAHCPDPRPGEKELTSCVMQRENDLRAELGLRLRTRYKWSRYARPI